MAALSVPELERLAKAKRRERHFEAVRLRWLVAVLYEVVQRAVAVGYVQAKAATTSKNHPLRFDRDLAKDLDRVPGYDKRLAKGR